MYFLGYILKKVNIFYFFFLEEDDGIFGVCLVCLLMGGVGWKLGCLFVELFFLELMLVDDLLLLNFCFVFVVEIGMIGDMGFCVLLNCGFVDVGFVVWEEGWGI